MKTLLAAVLMLASASAAHAGITERQIKVCSNLGVISSAIMYGRQSGKPLDLTMQLADRVSPTDKELIVSIIIDAYGYQRAASNAGRAAAVEEYGQQQQQLCLEVLNR